MQNVLKITAFAALVIALAACGGSAKDQKGDLGDKKVKLEELKKEKNKLDADIRQLEDEITKADPDAATVRKLVSVHTVTLQNFTHYIDLQGKVDANNVANVAPRGQGGTVKEIYVTQGQNVRKGQLILKLDDAVARQGVSVAQQQIAGAEAQYKLAQSVYERQQNLWKENIGSEVALLQRKAEAEGAASQLNGARAAVRQAQEQVNLSNVHAEISGTIDLVNVRVGEYFSPQSAAMPQTSIRIVNTNSLKALVLVPENYLSKVKVGTPLVIVLPESNNRIISSKVTVVGKLIDPTTRSFYAEGSLPANMDLRPNQGAVMRIEDYKIENATVVPVNIVQSDEKGKYLFVVETLRGKTIARRRIVITGESYDGQMEIKSGLKPGEQIITEGYQTVYDGQAISTVQ